MKAFETDWTEIFPALPAWLALSGPARRLAVEHLRPSGLHPTGPLTPVLEELLANGFAELSATKVRVGAPEAKRELIKLLRELDRAPVWGNATLPAAELYLAEHFSTEEMRGLGGPAGSRGWGWVSRPLVAEITTSAEWVEGFLACRGTAEAEAWERQRHAPGAEASFFVPAKVLTTTQRLVRALLAHPEGVPLAELPRLLTRVPMPLLGSALQAALRYVLVFAALGAELAPRVGLWPPVVARMNRVAPAPPAPVPVAEEFHAAVLMEDMTSVIVAMAAEPLRLRVNDGAIFARATQAIAERLTTAPDWTTPLVDEEREARVETARDVLEAMELAAVTGDVVRGRSRAQPEPRLEPTAQGTGWLSLTDHDRLARLLDRLRTPRTPKRGGWDQPEWGFSPFRVGYGEEDDLRGPLTAAFLSLPAEGFVPLADFLEYQTFTANPLLDPANGPRAITLHGYGRVLRREYAEQLWKQLMAAFLSERLVALGGARLGRTADGQLCVALASPGRYLLGATEEFEYGASNEAQVVVQPNFEIVFLTPAPKVEAQFGRFAERVGAAPGVVFRLTRASILNAAEAGISQRQILDTLSDGSREPVPANVERQVVDWLGEVRHVRLRTALLVECPDAESAARVRTAAGKQVRAITPTLLEVTARTKQARTLLQRQLRAAGVFVKGGISDA